MRGAIGWVVLAIVMWAAVGFVEAKKKPVPQAQENIGNWLDLRQETFACNDKGCALPVRGILLGCNVQGCRPITDIIVTPGPVNRAAPQVPAPAPAK